MLCDAGQGQDVASTSVDLIKVPTGPVTRVRAKWFKESLQALMRTIQEQEQDYTCIVGLDHEALRRTVMLIQVPDGRDSPLARDETYV